MLDGRQCIGGSSVTVSDNALTKNQAREIAYQQLHSARAARFPFPIEGRIPNFVGAEAAAARLRELPIYKKAKAIKVNPDAPQLPIRAMALVDGKTVYIPSPRLRSAFIRITPDAVPAGEERKAASLSHCHKYGVEVGIDELAQSVAGGGAIDLIVAGSVAVTRAGARAGKGEGYADLEYALLQELGMGPTPVVTTVHPGQIVPTLQVEAHDLTLDLIITPEEVIETQTTYPKPKGIDWNLLTEDDLAAMPILRELRQVRWEVHTTPTLIAPDLRILFVGLNPGRKSAGLGHNFAGPGNHFWRLLHESGLTPRQYKPAEEMSLLEQGLGITNIVSRASRGEADLTWEELLAGGETLRATVAEYRPAVLVLLGKNVYRAYAGLSRSARVEWGAQLTETVEGVRDFLAPNPSSRSTIPYQQRLDIFRALHTMVKANG